MEIGDFAAAGEFFEDAAWYKQKSSMFLARISTYSKLNPQKFSPAAAKSHISVYFQVVLLISEFLRELFFLHDFSPSFRVFSGFFEN